MWARQGWVSVWDVEAGNFVARFEEESDFNRALCEGPWLVSDHYVISEEWRPNFEPGYAQVHKIRAWVRLPSLPLEYFDAEILSMIGDKLGKTVRIDGTTLKGNRGNYARICVKVDLHQPLRSKYRQHGRVRRVEWEGLHEICFESGKYGHEQNTCPSLRKEQPTEEANSLPNLVANPTFQEMEDRPELTDDFGPWMKAKKNVRRRKQKGVSTKANASEAIPVRRGQCSRFSVLEEERVTLEDGFENDDEVRATTEVDSENDVQDPPTSVVAAPVLPKQPTMHIPPRPVGHPTTSAHMSVPTSNDQRPEPRIHEPPMRSSGEHGLQTMPAISSDAVSGPRLPHIPVDRGPPSRHTTTEGKKESKGRKSVVIESRSQHSQVGRHRHA
ncbi:hypothetical protein LINGRAHAP2_LOCUS13613 [Linum grandiflorum]